jgi:multidrug efflux pump
MDNNILTQVGFIVLIGLAAKNAILIVEFARQLEDQGRDRWAAAAEAARLRLRPILMTSLAFILGVMPLAIANGAGSGSQNSIGIGVMGGMISATVLGVFFIPLLFVSVRRVFKGKVPATATPAPASPDAAH